MREWPDNPAYVDAMARYSAGEYDAALVSISTALAAQPGRSRIHSNQAMILMALKRFEEAHTAADRGRQLSDADDHYPLWTIAKLRDGTGDSHGAVLAATQALEVAAAADRVSVLVTRAWALMRLGRERQAIRDARDALQIDPGRIDARQILARSLAAADCWGEGMRIIEAVLADAPDDDEAVELRDTLARGLAIASDAVTTARRECKKHPKDHEAWLALGMALTMTGKLVEAAEAFDRAHENNPDPADRWPEEPYMLSTWEVDCRIALSVEGTNVGVPAETPTRKRVPKRGKPKPRSRRRAEK